MTKDLALLVGSDQPWLTTTQFLNKIDERNKAREHKNYQLADKIRQDLLDKGILIEDKDGTTTWKLK